MNVLYFPIINIVHRSLEFHKSFIFQKSLNFDFNFKFKCLHLFDIQMSKIIIIVNIHTFIKNEQTNHYMGRLRQRR